MSNNKQIPTIQNTLDMMPISHFYDENGVMVCLADDVKAILEYRDKEVVKYTLQQAAENAKWTSESQDIGFGHSAGFDFVDTDYAGDPCTGYKVLIDKQSILSLEEQIIKDIVYEK